MRHVLFLLIAFSVVALAVARYGFRTDDSRAVPLRPVLLYYYQPEKDRDASGSIRCSREGLVPVFRVIEESPATIEETIRLLLRGELTGEERAGGFTSEYPLAGFGLDDVSFSDGVLTLSFSDPEGRTSGGACRVGILWFQIEMTARQFPEVKEVRFLPEELFQP